MCKSSRPAGGLDPAGDPRQDAGLRRAATARFLRDEGGSMSIFALFTALSLIAIGGIGIDFMLAEYKRTNIQATLDRAVLAAADLEQELDPATVVADYFEKMSLSDVAPQVSATQSRYVRTVTASAAVEMPSNVTSILGVGSLNASAVSSAEERISNVEISMVLDISGSMRDNDKIGNLRKAANTFIDTVLKPENDGRISISLVPYSEHVNAGPDLTSLFKVAWRHPYSRCLEIGDSQFDSTAFDMSLTYTQAQHFQYNYDPATDDRYSTGNTVCPRQSYAHIRTLSKSADALKGQIAQFVPRAGTSIFLGMKWATALLDPTHRPLIDAMVTANKVDAAFRGRPGDWDDADTLKTIVLMTDGENDNSQRIYFEWYNSGSEYEQFDRYNATWWAYSYLYDFQRAYFYQTKYTKELGDNLLDRICTAAKQKGIVIWSIGFEVEDHGAQVMQKCASSPAHFFRVEGLEIESAFYSIARTINQLRLTQ